MGREDDEALGRFANGDLLGDTETGHVDDGDGVSTGDGDEGFFAIGSETDVRRTLTNSDFFDDLMGLRVPDADGVIFLVSDEDVFAVRRPSIGDRAFAIGLAVENFEVVGIEDIVRVVTGGLDPELFTVRRDAQHVGFAAFGEVNALDDFISGEIEFGNGILIAFGSEAIFAVGGKEAIARKTADGDFVADGFGRNVDHIDDVAASRVDVGGLEVGSKHETMARTFGPSVDGFNDFDAFGVDGDGDELILRKVVRPDVLAVPIALFVREPANGSAERTSGENFISGSVNDSDIFCADVEDVDPERCAGRSCSSRSSGNAGSGSGC